MSDTPVFLNGESVRIKATGVETTVHHSVRNHGDEDWKFFIESRGRFLPFGAEELERIDA
jgi:hypothetical protein